MYGFGLYFAMAHRKQALNRLFDLQKNQRPQYFHLEEFPKRKDLKKIRSADDLEQYLDLPMNSLFFLSSESSKIFVRRQNSNLLIRGENDSTWHETFSILRHMMSACPLFGYGSCDEEYAHRNQLVVETTMGMEYSFNGRDIDRYVPGIYWITLLSDQLINMHKVRIDSLYSASTIHVNEFNAHLFQFYTNPEEWSKKKEELKLLSKPAGFFHKEDILNSIGLETDWRVVEEKVNVWP